MGIASNLFYNPDPDVSTLRKRCTPSQEQKDDQIDRWTELANFLIDEMNQITDYEMTTRLQGSYQYKTQIRPARPSDDYDLDLGLNFHWDGPSAQGDYKPKQLMGLVNDALKRYAAEHDEVLSVAPIKPRCCRIKYKGNFHIDVPVYHLRADTDKRYLATQDDTWEVSDPKELYLWYKNQFDDIGRARVRRQIQYLKAWAALQFEDEATRPPSVMLTVLVVEAIAEIGVDNLGREDEAFLGIVEKIITRLEDDVTIENPINHTEDLAAKLDHAAMSVFIRKLKTLEGIADKAVNATTLEEASIYWGEDDVFGFMFPAPATKSAVTRNLPALIQPIVRVWATEEGKTIPLMTGMDGIGQTSPVRKGWTVHFEVMNEQQLPPGAEIHWVVRNDGNEAASNNQLGHYAGSGKTMWRNTAYTGLHSMDCELRQFGSTIARKRIPVRVMGEQIPARNPVVRPEWVKHRKSRRR